MRKQCRSSLRQGMCFQVSLVCSDGVSTDGAFLSGIGLVPFPSMQQCSRQRILATSRGLGFLNNPATPPMRWAPACSTDPCCKRAGVVTPFHSPVLRCRRSGTHRRTRPSSERPWSCNRRPPPLVPFWVRLLSPRKPRGRDDGRDMHSIALTRAASLRRRAVGLIAYPRSLPLYGLMASRGLRESAVYFHRVG